MNILVLNTGSASLKFEVIVTGQGTRDPLDGSRKLVSGAVEGIGENAVFSLLEVKRVVYREEIDAPDHDHAARHVLAWLDSKKNSQLRGSASLDAIGVRVVHGGERFSRAVRVDDQVIADIEALQDLAPLHNAPAVASIRLARDVLGRDVPMVAVFDTVFHRTIPSRAGVYALPFELARRHRIHRYGFHGISHEYLVRRYARITNTTMERVTVITLHLESGCSACAVHHGQSVDTSMGFTPLEGLMMGSRSGDIDPSIVGYLARKERASVERVEEWLNKESGLLGVSGRSHDTRELMKWIDTEERVRLALEIFCYRLRKYIGAYLAALGGAEAIIFGGGIGENMPLLRAWACDGLGWSGLKLDSAANEETVDREGRITTSDSRLHAWVIPVEEGLMIAGQTMECLEGRKSR